MKAGSLNTRVSIQSPSVGQDAVGQPLSGWATLADVWADVRPGTGVEAVRAGAPVAIVRASIRIRRRAGITNGMRVLVGATAYEIEAVIPGGSRQEFADLVCKVVS